VTFTIFRGAALDWDAVGRWTPGYLSSNVPDKMVRIESDGVVRACPLAEAFTAATGDDAYVFQTSILFEMPQLLPDLYLPSGAPDPSQLLEINLWCGPVGNCARLHFDTKTNFYAQISGTKRFLLIDPALNDIDLNEPDCPRWRCSRADPAGGDWEVEEVILHPGDILFMDAFMGHDVRALTDSISVNFWYRADLKNVSAEMVCRLAVWLSTQPDPRTELSGYVAPDGDVDTLGAELVSVSRRYLTASSTPAYRAANWGTKIEALAASLAA
jgi:cupin-like protein